MVYVVLGIFLILFGIRLFFHPAWYSLKYGAWFDFTGYNIPFGCFCIFVGLLFVWSEIRKGRKRGTKTNANEKGEEEDARRL